MATKPKGNLAALHLSVASVGLGKVVHARFKMIARSSLRDVAARYDASCFLALLIAQILLYVTALEMDAAFDSGLNFNRVHSVG